VRRLAPALVLLAAAGLAGCGLASGTGGGDARVLVTRDFGSETLGARIVQDVPSSATAMRLLERGFKVSSRAGDVQTIDGLAGGREGGRPVDWFLYVNGVESEQGAASVDVHGGDRVWWDRHDRNAAPHVPAVVGSFPEPFLHGAGGKRIPLVLECADDVDAACGTVQSRLSAAGAIAARQLPGTGAGERTLRVLVGTWSEIHGDAALEQLDRGPRVSGVFARFGDSGRSLALLDATGAVAQVRGAGTGLVAATRFEQQAPTWAITGTDVAGVAAAARALDERTLQAHFALAIDPGGDVPLPLQRR